jgi:hypothetical protein
LYALSLFLIHVVPDVNDGILRYHHIEIRKLWLTPLTGYLYIVLLLSALSSYLCLIITVTGVKTMVSILIFYYYL